MDEARPKSGFFSGARFGSGPAIGAGAVVLVVIVALIATLVWPGYQNRETAYAFKGGTYEPPNPAASIDLVDQDDEPFSLAACRGKVLLVYFGYTYCPNFCPTTVVEMQKVKDLLGDKASDVEVIMVTVDPERDTPARLKEYMEFFDPTFIGLSGSDAQIDAIKAPYGIFGEKQPADANGQYLVDHSTSLYAIDPEGNLRLTWAYGTAPEDISSDVEHILDQRKSKETDNATIITTTCPGDRFSDGAGCDFAGSRPRRSR